MKSEVLKEIAAAFSNIEEEKALDSVEKAMEENVQPREILEGGLMKGLDRVGEKYESGEYFLSELLMSSIIADKVIEKLKPHLIEGEVRSKGKVLIGTVKGDLHDIGKNLVKSLLSASGFEVHDLGVDVPPEQFMKKIDELNPDIVGISALLTVSLPMIEETVQKMNDSGRRGKVKILLGGRAVSKKFVERLGVDGYAGDAFEAVKVAEKFV